MMDEMKHFFSGEALYGNDFSQAEIEEWFADEAEGYAELGQSDRSSYAYGYHALNTYHGYSRFSLQKGSSVLAFGAAYGDELLPIAEYIGSAVIIDPSDKFSQSDSQIANVRWVKPAVSGEIDFPVGTFDLATCLGVLHHIPNVEFVIQEINRVLKPNGVLMLREPIVSMGDWRKPRRGLTRRERGIPLGILRKFIDDAGFMIEREALCMFSPLQRLTRIFGLKRSVFDSRLLTAADSGMSIVMRSGAEKYHRVTVFSRFAPSSVFYVLRKLDR